MQVEHSINFVRMGVFSFGAAADVVTAVVQQMLTLPYILFIAASSVFAAGYLAFVHLASSGSRYRGWLKYLTITLDCAIPAAFLFEMMRPEFAARVPAESVVPVTALIVMIVVLLNALRLSTWAVIYASLLGAGIVLASTFSLEAQPIARLWLAPLVLVAGAVTWWISRNVRSIIRALRRREKLARFLPHDLVAVLDGSDLEVTLGGKTIPVTVLFADIRGFTGYCEDRPPAEVVAVLNEYFTAMTAVIREHGGMIDKFVGDAVMAVFGAPLAREDHAARAAAAAAGMLARLEELNAAWKEAGGPSFDIGIALHTGAALAGTIGAPDRMDYTVIGDTVNLTARLEELNKTYHTSVILSEDTLRGIDGGLPARFLGEVAIRGRTRPVRIYTMGAGPR